MGISTAIECLYFKRINNNKTSGRVKSPAFLFLSTYCFSPHNLNRYIINFVMKKKSALSDNTFRQILEFMVTMAAIVLIVVVVLSNQSSGGTNSSEEDAQIMYNNLTQVIGEKSAREIDKLLCLSFDSQEKKLLAAASSGDKLIDISLAVDFANIHDYLPSLLNNDFARELQSDVLTLDINDEVIFDGDDSIENIVYEVAIYGPDTYGYGTCLSTDGTYTSFYHKEYDNLSSSWIVDSGNSITSHSEGDKTLFELYKLIIND